MKNISTPMKLGAMKHMLCRKSTRFTYRCSLSRSGLRAGCLRSFLSASIFILSPPRGKILRISSAR